MNIIADLAEKGLAFPPNWLPDNIGYLTVMGSKAYGCSDNDSDWDVYGFAIPPRNMIFPHLDGIIPGFGNQHRPFEQYQEHHLRHPDGREYDFAVYNIIKFFQLCMENNPNMIDSLFTPDDCVIYQSKVGRMVREQRRIFLHQGCLPKFRGYAYSQIKKLDAKQPEPGSRRHGYVERYGYDVKYAVHLVRLVLECEQILQEGDIDLRRHADTLKAVRAGQWTEAEVKAWFSQREEALDTMRFHSDLPAVPDEARIRELLLNCLEEHYENGQRA